MPIKLATIFSILPLCCCRFQDLSFHCLTPQVSENTHTILCNHRYFIVSAYQWERWKNSPVLMEATGHPHPEYFWLGDCSKLLWHPCYNHRCSSTLLDLKCNMVSVHYTVLWWTQLSLTQFLLRFLLSHFVCWDQLWMINTQTRIYHFQG